jgi:hypothetical protein
MMASTFKTTKEATKISQKRLALSATSPSKISNVRRRKLGLA